MDFATDLQNRPAEPKRSLLVRYILTFGFPLFLIYLSFTPAFSLRSVDDIYALPTDHALFGGPKKLKDYTHKDYYNPDVVVTQGERLSAIRVVTMAASRVFAQTGVDLFADAGTLLGIVRHGDLVPWDNDADMGFLAAQCASLYPEKGALQKKVESFLPPGLAVPYLECTEAKDSKAGRIVDKSTGFFVDIFPYAHVDAKKLSAEKKKVSNEWIERIGWTSTTFPTNFVLPMKRVMVWDTEFLIPHDEYALLDTMYHGNTGIQLWPWGFLCYIHVGYITFAFFCICMRHAIKEHAIINFIVTGLMLIPGSGLRFVGLAYTLVRVSLTMPFARDATHTYKRVALLALTWMLIIFDGRFFIRKYLLVFLGPLGLNTSSPKTLII